MQETAVPKLHWTLITLHEGRIQICLQKASAHPALSQFHPQFSRACGRSKCVLDIRLRQNSEIQIKKHQFSYMPHQRQLRQFNFIVTVGINLFDEFFDPQALGESHTVESTEVRVDVCLWCLLNMYACNIACVSEKPTRSCTLPFYVFFQAGDEKKKCRPAVPLCHSQASLANNGESRVQDLRSRSV